MMTKCEYGVVSALMLDAAANANGRNVPSRKVCEYEFDGDQRRGSEVFEAESGSLAGNRVNVGLTVTERGAFARVRRAGQYVCHPDSASLGWHDRSELAHSDLSGLPDCEPASR